MVVPKECIPLTVENNEPKLSFLQLFWNKNIFKREATLPIIIIIIHSMSPIEVMVVDIVLFEPHQLASNMHGFILFSLQHSRPIC